MIKIGDRFARISDPKNIWVVSEIINTADIIYVRSGWLNTAVSKNELLDETLWLRITDEPQGGLKCECGAVKAEIPWHYQWCPMDTISELLFDNFDDEEFII